MIRKQILALLAAIVISALAVCACAADEAVIACVGDSLTFGVIPNTAGKQSESNYPAMLNQLLGEGFDVQNYGKPGSSLTENGVCYRNRDGYQLSLDAAAQMYIIMLGTNDSNPANEWDAALFESDLKDMVDAYRGASPDAIICLIAPPELFPNQETGEYALNEELLRNEICPIVARVAQEKDAKYIDLLAATEDHPEWIGGDGIHFLDEGYAQIAQIVYDSIKDDALSLP